MRKILVTGVGGPAGRSVAKLLLARGFSVLGTDCRTLTLPQLQFTTIPPASSPDFLSAVCSLAEREQVALVIPTVSEELPILAGSWQSTVPLLISSPDSVRVADDKYLTCRLLQKEGVAVPRFLLPSQVSTEEEIEQTLGWPCISKPKIGRGGRGVRVYKKEDFPSLLALDDSYILQEFIPGAEYGPNLFLGQDFCFAAVIIKTELKGGVVGNAKSALRTHNTQVEKLAIDAARALDLMGPVDLDLRQRADGSLAVLELNARFGANIALAPEVLGYALSSFGVTP